MWRVIGRIVGSVVFVIGLPVAVAVFGIRGAIGEIYSPPPSFEVATSAQVQPAHDRSKPTVAVVVGEDGANVADSLAPFEVFATTDAFNVYTVAERREPVPLTGGLDLLPDLTFAQLEQLVPEAPDVIVIPEIHGSKTAVVSWLQRQRERGDPLLMSVCVGAETLAATGLLDGRPATSHWLKLIGLRRSYPTVEWTEGVRFVDDGEIITTAGVLSGTDGALRVIERMLGAAEATRIAERLHWKGYPLAPAEIPRSRPAFPDSVALLGAAYRWDRPTTGVLLTDGVGEIELASAFRPLTNLSFLARLVALSSDGRPVRSRHGLVFLPRSDWAAGVAEVDRVLVPGADAARAGVGALLPRPTGVQFHYLHDDPGFPLDGALRDIARTYDVATAHWVAKSIQYPTRGLDLVGDSWPWSLTLRPVMLTAVAVMVLLGLRWIWRRPRAKGLR